MVKYLFDPFQSRIETPSEIVNKLKQGAPSKSTPSNKNGTVDFQAVKGSATYNEEYASHYKYQATKTETTETVSPPVSGTIDAVKSTKPVVPVFAMGNNQSDGSGNKLKRVEFEFMGKSYKFNLNPEEYSQDEPNRVSVMETKGGAYVDDFGGGVPILSMKGTTGFKANGGTNATNQYGFQKFKELRDMVRKYYFAVAPGSEITQDKEMIFYNYTDGEYWVVVPQEFKLMRSVSRPLLYLYDIKLILLRPASTPAGKGGTGDSLGYLEQVEVNYK